MPGRVEVGACVLQRRAIAAANRSAGQAHPKLDPLAIVRLASGTGHGISREFRRTGGMRAFPAPDGSLERHAPSMAEQEFVHVGRPRGLVPAHRPVSPPALFAVDQRTRSTLACFGRSCVGCCVPVAHVRVDYGPTIRIRASGAITAISKGLSCALPHDSSLI